MTPHNDNLIGRLRWWLLPHIGFYCDGTDAWRWWMRLARWAWTALGWLPRSDLYEPWTPPVCSCDYCRGVPGAEYQA